MRHLEGEDEGALQAGGPEPLYDQVVVSVKVADLNYDALKPLACRLKQEDGTVGQHSLSAILKQTLEGH